MQPPDSHLDTLDEVSCSCILHSLEELCKGQRLRRLGQLQIISHARCSRRSRSFLKEPLKVCSCVRGASLTGNSVKRSCPLPDLLRQAVEHVGHVSAGSWVAAASALDRTS